MAECLGVTEGSILLALFWILDWKFCRRLDMESYRQSSSLFLFFKLALNRWAAMSLSSL